MCLPAREAEASYRRFFHLKTPLEPKGVAQTFIFDTSRFIRESQRLLRFNRAKSRPNFYDAKSLLLSRICDSRIGYETSWRRENLHPWNPPEGNCRRICSKW